MMVHAAPRHPESLRHFPSLQQLCQLRLVANNQSTLAPVDTRGLAVDYEYWKKVVRVAKDGNGLFCPVSLDIEKLDLPPSPAEDLWRGDRSSYCGDGVLWVRTEDDRMSRFDLVEGWRELGGRRDPEEGGALAWHAGRLLVVGGQRGVVHLDNDGNETSGCELNVQNAAKRRRGYAAVLGDSAYTWGREARTMRHELCVERIDLDSGRCEMLENAMLVSPHNAYVTAVPSLGIVFSFGGEDLLDHMMALDVPMRFDPRVGRWEWLNKERLPAAVGMPYSPPITGCCCVDDRVYVGAGAAVCCYDARADKWEGERVALFSDWSSYSYLCAL